MRALALCTFTLAFAAATSAQPPAPTPPAPKPAEPAPATAPPPRPAPPTPLPELDDLLGTGGEKPGAGEGGALPTPDRADLDRKLSGEEMGDLFKEAVGLMGDAAGRLKVTEKRDGGIQTQRMQEDAIRKLDKLLEAMQKNSSSSSKKKSQPQPQDSQGEKQPNRGKSKQNDGAKGENNAEPMPPGAQAPQLRPELESARAAWGSLPPRVREMLLQGSGDKFSSLYDSLTQAYYRRLAEEGKPK